MNSLEDEIQRDDGLLDDVVLVPSTLPIESFSSQLVTTLGINSQQLRAETALAYNNTIVAIYRSLLAVYRYEMHICSYVTI